MRKILASVVLTMGLLAIPVSAHALTPDIIGNSCTVDGDSALCKSRDDNIGTFVADITNVLLWVVGILAVIMIIFGGIRYITSAGDSAKLTSAKNTILYSVIGLLIAIFAYAIVAWVNTSVTVDPEEDESAIIIVNQHEIS